MISIMYRPLEDVFASGMTRELAASEVLFRTGDRVASIFLLRRGGVDLVRHTGHGLRLILHRSGIGQIIAEASAWSETYHCDAVTTEGCAVAVLPRHVFCARLRDTPDLAEVCIRNLAQAVQSARMRAEIRSLPRVADRLDAWLGEDNHLPGKGQWQEVAAELGVTREALYRELSRRRKGSDRAARGRA